MDKTGCVSVFGNIFEVPSHLSSQTVTLRFDPYDLSVMQVWHDGNRLPDAQLLDLNRSIHERVKSRSKVEKQEDAPATGLNFFKMAEEKRRNVYKYEAIAQRIHLQYHLSGLNAQETAAYIRHQMKNANMTTPVFSDSALALIHSETKGIPRLINTFCTHPLYERYNYQNSIYS